MTHPAVVVVSALVLAAGLASGCREEARPAPGPIVLVTLAGLRFDVAGPESRRGEQTPRIDELDAHWRGAAVAASSDPVVALASLLCGVNPWHHQLVDPEHPERRRVPTLGQVLQSAGYRPRAFVPERLRGALGEGFATGGDPTANPGVTRALAEELTDGDFIWLHFTDADLARRRRPRGRGGQGRERHRLRLYSDPGQALAAEDRRALWEAYSRGVERLDQRVGSFLRRLAANPAWERTTLIVTGSQGTEIGEHGQILYGENLGRETIEVPLWIHLGEGIGPLAEPSGSRVAQIRLWTTLVEIAGMRAAPGYRPSLFRRSAAPVLSELYAKNGVNFFSLVSPQKGDEHALQLHWTGRFAPPEPDYWAAVARQAGGRSRTLHESGHRILARIDEAFRRTPPLSGMPGSTPELELERWKPAGGTERVDDPAAARELAVRLREEWMRFLDRERAPELEWNLGRNPASGGLTPAPAPR